MPDGTDHDAADYDFKDWWHQQEERAGMRGEFPGGDAPPRSRFQFLTDGELENLPLPHYVIDKTIVEQCLALLVGEPGTYKSFIALAFAMCVKAGRPFAGRAVKQGAVVYVLAEGRGMFSLRTQAWKQHHGVAGDLGVCFLTQAVQLADRGDVAALIDAILALPERPVLIIVDTLARSAVGLNENSAEHMGALIAGADRIREATGAAVLLLHHTPRGEERERGSTALRGATDTLLLATVDGDFITLSVRRQKDIEEAEPITLRKRVLELQRADGRIKTSVVLVPVTDAEQTGIPRGVMELPESQRKLLLAIHRNGAKSNAQLIKLAELEERKFYRAIRRLRDRKLVRENSNGLTPDGAGLFESDGNDSYAESKRYGETDT